MALETGTFISDLVPTNPVGSDPLAFADDHLRLLKGTIKNTFPNISGAVSKTHTQLNNTVDQSRTVTGTGSLTGGGDLTANRTLDVANGGISTAKIADAGVTTAKIADGAITAGKVASGVAKANLGWSQWGVVEVSGVLYFQHNGVSKAKLESDGTLTVVGNVVAFGTM